MAWSSWGPGHPAANGLGPDTTRKSFTWYGPPDPAPAADGAPSSSRTLASSAKPAGQAILDLIAHPSLMAAGSPRLVAGKYGEPEAVRSQHESHAVDQRELSIA